MVAYEDLSSQFSIDGDLAMQFEQVETGTFISCSKFINMVLVLNLAMSFKEKLMKVFENLKVDVSSIEGDLVRITLCPG